MALTTDQKASMLFKKWLGKGETTTVRQFFEEPYEGRSIVFQNQIWSDSESITTTAPSLLNGQDNGIVKYYIDLALVAVAGTTNSFQSDSLKDAIPFNFGDGSYNYAIKDHTGSAIPFGQGDWIVDTEAGTLTFYGDDGAVDYPDLSSAPTITFYQYVGGKGGGSGDSLWYRDSIGSPGDYATILLNRADTVAIGNFVGSPLMSAIDLTVNLHLYESIKIGNVIIENSQSSPASAELNIYGTIIPTELQFVLGTSVNEIVDSITGSPVGIGSWSTDDQLITAKSVYDYVTSVVSGTVNGTGIAGQVAFWIDTDTISSSTDYLWDDINLRLRIGIITGDPLPYASDMGLDVGGNIHMYMKYESDPTSTIHNINYNEHISSDILSDSFDFNHNLINYTVTHKNVNDFIGDSVYILNKIEGISGIVDLGYSSITQVINSIIIAVNSLGSPGNSSSINISTTSINSSTASGLNMSSIEQSSFQYYNSQQTPGLISELFLTSASFNIDFNSITEFTLDNTGIKLNTGTNVNEIVDSVSGSPAGIGSWSTDDQLATTKAIYDYIYSNILIADNQVAVGTGTGIEGDPNLTWNSSTTTLDVNGIIRYGTYGIITQDSKGLQIGSLGYEGSNVIVSTRGGYSHGIPTDIQGNYNVYLGHDGLNSAATGDINIMIGFYTGYNLTTGYNNIFMGYSAGEHITTGYQTIAIGQQSGDGNNGHHNVSLGAQLVGYNSSGDHNFYAGTQRTGYNIDGDFNVAIGGEQVFFADLAGFTANYSVAIGPKHTGGAGDYNLAIGYEAGQYTTANLSIYIGTSVGRNWAGVDETILIDTQYRASGDYLFRANGAARTLQLNATVTINQAYTLPIIDGSTDYVLRTDGAGNVSWSDVDVLSSNYWQRSSSIVSFLNSGDTLRLQNNASPEEYTDLYTDSSGDFHIIPNGGLFYLELGTGVNEIIDSVTGSPAGIGTWSTDYQLVTAKAVWDAIGLTSSNYYLSAVTVNSIDDVDFTIAGGGTDILNVDFGHDLINHDDIVLIGSPIGLSIGDILKWNGSEWNNVAEFSLTTGDLTSSTLNQLTISGGVDAVIGTGTSISIVTGIIASASTALVTSATIYDYINSNTYWQRNSTIVSFKTDADTLRLQNGSNHTDLYTDSSGDFHIIPNVGLVFLELGTGVDEIVDSITGSPIGIGNWSTDNQLVTAKAIYDYIDDLSLLPGTGEENQIAYFSSTDVITGSNFFKWDGIALTAITNTTASPNFIAYNLNAAGTAGIIAINSINASASFIIGGISNTYANEAVITASSSTYNTNLSIRDELGALAMYFDLINLRIGVKKNNPAYEFDVDGTIASTGLGLTNISTVEVDEIVDSITGSPVGIGSWSTDNQLATALAIYDYIEIIINNSVSITDTHVAVGTGTGIEGDPNLTWDGSTLLIGSNLSIYENYIEHSDGASINFDEGYLTIQNSYFGVNISEPSVNIHLRGTFRIDEGSNLSHVDMYMDNTDGFHINIGNSGLLYLDNGTGVNEIVDSITGSPVGIGNWSTDDQLATAKTIYDYVEAQIVALPGDIYVTNGSFEDTTGDITLTRSESQSDIVFNLDGRYSLDTHNHTLDSLSNVTILGSPMNIDDILKWNGTSWENVADEAGENYYATSLSFNTGDGILEIGRTSPLDDMTVDLDGRYSLDTHNHTLDSLINVTILGSPVNIGDILKWNGISWENVADEAGVNYYLSAVDASDITAVDFTITNGTDVLNIDFSHTHPISEIVNLQVTLDSKVNIFDSSPGAVDNQIAIWTDSTTIEGDSNFTWDGLLFDVSGAMQLSLGTTANEIIDAVTGSPSGIGAWSTDDQLVTAKAVYNAIAASGGGTVSGTGVVNQVTYWIGTNLISSDANFTWNNLLLDISGSIQLSLGTSVNEIVDSVTGSPAGIGSWSTDDQLATTKAIYNYVEAQILALPGDIYVTNGSFEDTTGDITLTRSESQSDIVFNLDGRYSYDTHNHTLDSLSNVTILGSPINTGDILKWNGTSWENVADEAGVNYYLSAVDASDITSVDFTITNGTDVLAVDFGHTLTTHDDVVIIGSPIELSIGDILKWNGSEWNNVADESGNNYYVNSISFNTSDGILTLGRTSPLGDLTVDLDDRYSLDTHNHTLDSLSNVTILGSPMNIGDILKWNGTSWENVTDETGDNYYLSNVIVNSIDDVDFTMTGITDITGIDFSHTHPISEIINLQITLDGKVNIFDSSPGAADNQIAIWTDSTTIEGDADFTWDGSNLYVNGTTQVTGIFYTNIIDTYNINQNLIIRNTLGEGTNIEVTSDGDLKLFASGFTDINSGLSVRINTTQSQGDVNIGGSVVIWDNGTLAFGGNTSVNEIVDSVTGSPTGIGSWSTDDQLVTALAIYDYVEAQIVALPGDIYVTGGSFATGDGNITLTRSESQSNIVFSLDGRYSYNDHNHTLDSLSNVTILGSPMNIGDILKWNGTSWENVADETGDNYYLSAVDASDITAVDFTITNGTDVLNVDFSHTHPISEIVNLQVTLDSKVNIAPASPGYNDNQIAVWTDSSSIEGTDTFTWNGTLLNVSGAMQLSLGTSVNEIVDSVTGSPTGIGSWSTDDQLVTAKAVYEISINDGSNDGEILYWNDTNSEWEPAAYTGIHWEETLQHLELKIVHFATTSPPAWQEGLLFYDSSNHTLSFYNDESDISLQIGQEMLVRVYNDSGALIEDGSVVRHDPNGSSILAPNIIKAQADNIDNVRSIAGIATHDIENGTFGYITRIGLVRGINTSIWDVGDGIWLSATVAGGLTNVRPDFPNYPISLAAVISSAVSGDIYTTLRGQPNDILNNAWNGNIIESMDFLVTSNGTIVSGSLERAGGGDLTLYFSSGLSILDCTPTLSFGLTAGTDSSPQMNYVYIPESTKTITVSTAGWPSEEHAKIGTAFIRSALATQAEGALKNHNWNDHIAGLDLQGHILHIATRMRQMNAKWDNGTEAFMTISGIPSDVYISNTAGEVYQLHLQTYPAHDMNGSPADSIHIVNDPVTAYKTVENLNTITTDSAGASLNTKYFKLVVWGVVNKNGEPSHLMCNLPSGSYSQLASAEEDSLNYANYNIPNDFLGVGFLMASFTIRILSGTWTLYTTTDLRGLEPNNTVGSGTGGSGAVSFLGLTDTPSAYTGMGGWFVKVNSGASALEFIESIAQSEVTNLITDLASKVDIGTGPVTNRIGVWEDTTTMLGDTNLTWDGSILDISGAIQLSTGTSVNEIVDSVSGSPIGIGSWSTDDQLATAATIYDYVTAQISAENFWQRNGNIVSFENNNDTLRLQYDSSNYVDMYSDDEGKLILKSGNGQYQFNSASVNNILTINDNNQGIGYNTTITGDKIWITSNSLITVRLNSTITSSMVNGLRLGTDSTSTYMFEVDGTSKFNDTIQLSIGTSVDEIVDSVTGSPVGIGSWSTDDQLATTKAIYNYVEAQIVALPGDIYVTDGSFDTNDGNITLTRSESQSDIIFSLDGRYSYDDHNHTLDSLSNVTILGSPVNIGDILKWNGSSWENVADESGDNYYLSAVDASNITSVDFTITNGTDVLAVDFGHTLITHDDVILIGSPATLAIDDILKWNGSEWNNVDFAHIHSISDITNLQTELNDKVDIGTGPVANRIGVWEDSTTIEGDTNLTWDGSILDVSGAIQLSLGTSVNEIVVSITGSPNGIGSWSTDDQLGTAAAIYELVTNSTAASTTYTNVEEVPETIGGIAEGETFDNKTLQEMWTKLLYPYQEPAFLSFTNDYQANYMECGESLPASTRLFSWTIDNVDNANDDILIRDVTGSTVLESGISAATPDSSSIAVGYAVTRTTPGSYTWRIEGTDTESNPYNRSTTRTWRWMFHWGSSLLTSLTTAQILALSGSELRASVGKTITHAATSPSEYKYYVMSDDYAISNVTLVGFGLPMAGPTEGYNNGPVNGYYFDTVSHTNDQGLTSDFRVYRTLNALGGAIDLVYS